MVQAAADLRPIFRHGPVTLPGRDSRRSREEAGEDGAAEVSDEFAVGTGVYHDEYGPGVVERKWYTDGTLLVQVRFESGRVAKFLPKYTRLERISLGE